MFSPEMADSLNPNITSLNTDIFHGWMSPPKTRGTSQILYSCLLTISACIYTSIHLNIPDPQEKQRWQTIRKIKWAVIGVFAPELVLYAAWTQYREASHFITKLCEVAPDLFYMEPKWTWKFWTRATSRSTRLHARKEAVQPLEMNQSAAEETDKMLELPVHEKDVRLHINLSYGFYAIMGGIRVDTSDLDDETSSLALSTSKLMEILDSPSESRHEFLKSLRIDLNTVKDRSKANSITKILICCQVLGTAIQCIARKAHGLPLTLLEYHTFAHVVCAIGIYSVWFRKPLDVNESSIVHLPDELRIGLAKALVLYRPKYWYYQMPHVCGAANTLITVSERFIKLVDPKNSESVALKQYGRDTIDMSHNKLKFHNHAYKDDLKTAYPRLNASLWEQQVTHVGQNKLIVQLHPRSSKGVDCSCADPSKRYLAVMDFTERDQNRWNALSSEGSQSHDRAEYGGLGSLYQSRRPNYFALMKQWSFKAAETGCESYLDPLDDYLGIRDILEDRSKSSIAATITASFITGLYGGVHAFAWHTHFPSIHETWFWRCSCVMSIAFFPLLAAPTYVVIVASDESNKPDDEYGIFSIRTLIALVASVSILVILIILLANFLARLFLVVETFVSLRSVPIGVYTTVSWTQCLPHL